MTDVSNGEQPKLRRELSLVNTVAVSVGIMAPTAVLALNGVLPASLVGRGVPLIFVLSSIAILFVCYGFCRLSQHISHAGSVYAFAGKTVGPRFGFLGGWALLATYISFAAGTAALAGSFASQGFADHGIHVDWLVFALVAVVLVAVLAYADIKIITRALLGIEGLSLVLVAVLFVTIYVKILSHHAPNHQSFTLSPFTFPHGTPISIVGVASVGGFLSFAGFEGTATLGEESQNPRRTIPRALLAVVITLAVLFTFGMFTEVIGFGTDKAGITAFSGSASAIGDLAKAYLNNDLASLIALGAAFSALGSTLGTGVASSRILFALGRDGFGPRALGKTAGPAAQPIAAIATVVASVLATVIGFRIEGTDPADVFFYLGTLGVLLILLAYIGTNVGAINYFFIKRRATIATWELIIPVAAIVVLAYVIYKNLVPIPAAPYNVLPYLAGGWMLLGLLIVCVAPGLATSIGRSLSAEAVEESELLTVAPNSASLGESPASA